MSPLFKCRVKVPRHSSKKNEKEPAKRGKRFFLKQTAAAKFVEDWLIRALKIEKLKQRIDEPITCDLQAVLTFYFPETLFFTKKGLRSKTIPDQSNLYQLPEDVLQKVGIIANDTQIVSHDGSRRKPIEGSEYWLEIELNEFKD